MLDSPATLLKKRLQHRCFPVNSKKFSYRTPPVAASRVLKTLPKIYDGAAEAYLTLL